jgi:NADH:ubiquinone oxidoreductase subunit E
MNDSNHTKVDLTLMEDIYNTYKDQPGALIPVLQRAQTLYGYLPPDVLRWIADRFDVAPGKVHGVATFYAQFSLAPKGQHVLKLCDGTACHVKGSQALAAAVAEEHNVAPGATTKDGALTVERVYCMGSCALAPVTVLDGEIMGQVRPDDLLQELRDRLNTTPNRTSAQEHQGASHDST